VQFEGGLAEWLQLHAKKVAAEAQAKEEERRKHGHSSHDEQGGGSAAPALDRFAATLPGTERSAQPTLSALLPPNKAAQLGHEPITAHAISAADPQGTRALRNTMATFSDEKGGGKGVTARSRSSDVGSNQRTATKKSRELYVGRAQSRAK
jgi:hypothetical protein